VTHQDEKDSEASEEVDAVETVPATGGDGGGGSGHLNINVQEGGQGGGVTLDGCVETDKGVDFDERNPAEISSRSATAYPQRCTRAYSSLPRSEQSWKGTDGTRLQVDHGKDETALVEQWPVHRK